MRMRVLISIAILTMICPLQAEETREIRVLAVMDGTAKSKLRGFKWNGYFKEIISRATESFKKQAAIRFQLADVASWDDADIFDNAAGMLMHLRDEIDRDVDRKDADIIMGLTAREGVASGVAADYLGGNLVVQVTGDRDKTAHHMARGFARLLGALPMTQQNTLMGRVNDPKAEYPMSPATEQVVRVHRDRPFEKDTFPVPSRDVPVALEAYERLSGDIRDPGELYMRLGLLRRSVGEATEATELYARGLALLSGNSISPTDLSQIRSLMDAASPEGRASDRLVIQGRLADLEGRREEAIAFFAKALKQDTTLFSAHYALGTIYLAERDWPKAQEHMESANRLEKSLPGLYLDLGDVYMGIHKPAAARWAAQEALKLDPGLASAHGMIAQAFITQRKPRPKEAEAACATAFLIDEGNGRARMALAQIYIQKGRGEKAIEEAKRAIGDLPGSAEAYYTLGNAYMSNEEFKRAADAFRKAVQWAPTHAKAHTHLAIAYYNLQELEQALDHAKKGLSLGFTDAKGIVDAISNQMSR